MTRSTSRWIAALLFLSLIGSFVSAATVTITWTPPTQNTDDTAIPATGAGSLVTYRVEYGTCSAPGVFGVKAGEVTRAAPATGTTLNLNPGTSCVRAYVNNTYGNESAPSNVQTSVVAAPTPKPPALATIPLAINVPLDSGDGFKRTVAYTITANGPGVLAGFVKVGTPVTAEPVFTYRAQNYCPFLESHPRTGASNIAWDKGVVHDISKVAAPCA